MGLIAPQASWTGGAVELVSSIFGGLKQIVTSPRAIDLAGGYLKSRADARTNEATALAAAVDADRKYSLLLQENQLRAQAIKAGLGFDSSATLSSRFLGVPDQGIYYAGNGGQLSAVGSGNQTLLYIGGAFLAYLLLTRKGRR